MRPPSLLVAGIVLLACVLLSVVTVPADRSAMPLVPRLPGWAVIAGWTLLALALLAAAGWAALDWARRRRRRSGQTEDRPVSLWPLLLASAAGLILTFGLAGLAISLLKPLPLEPGQGAPPRVEREAEESEPEETGAAPRSFDLRTLGIVLLVSAGAAGIALVAVLAFRLVRERRGLPERSEEALASLRRELSVGLRLSLAEILADADYRRAVIACYARMEKSFAAAGFARAEPETPFEYLARVLRDAVLVAAAGPSRAVDGALAELTGLYEIARFSEHAVPPADRARAIDALGLLEAALAGQAGGAEKQEAR